MPTAPPPPQAAQAPAAPSAAGLALAQQAAPAPSAPAPQAALEPGIAPEAAPQTNPGAEPTSPPSSVAKTSHAPGDPWEHSNRKFFNFNQKLDARLIGPTARGYKASFPQFLQRVLHNFVTNVSEPVVFANDVLQLQPKRAAQTGFRFVVNSTAGIGGMFNPAQMAGIEHHDNDFGITLGRYGCPPGPYLYSPILGPSTVRDSLGKAVDGFLIDPLNWIGYRGVIEHPPPPKRPYFHHENEIPRRDALRVGVAILSGLDLRSRIEEDLNTMMSTATDPYATMRSVYLQHREAMVDEARWKHHGEEVPDFSTPADTSPAASTSAPAVASAAAPAAAPPGGAPVDVADIAARDLKH